MAPPFKTSIGVIIYDLKTANQKESEQALLEICTSIYLAGNKEDFKLIFLNASPKDGSSSRENKNIEISLISPLKPKKVSNEIKNFEAVEGACWMKAVLLAIELIKSVKELPGIMVVNSQILLISDLGSQFESGSEGDQQAKKIARKLDKHDINMFVIGPKVNFKSTITSSDDVKDVLEEDEEYDRLNLDVKKVFSQTSNCIICNIRIGKELCFTYRWPRSMQPWKVPLEFGTKLEIPVVVERHFSYPSIAKNVPLHKLPVEKKKVNTTSVERHFSCASIDKNLPLYKLPVEKEKVNTPSGPLVSGFLSHDKLVITQHRSFKPLEERSFKVVGFTDKKNIPMVYFRGETSYCVSVDESSASKQQHQMFFKDFAADLANKDLYGIVRRVYTYNCFPQYYALIPERTRFIMSPIPFADDFQFDNLEVKQAEKKQSPIDPDVNNFMDGRNISSDKCKIKVALAPQMSIDNSWRPKVYEFLRKQVGWDFELVEVNENLKVGSNGDLKGLFEKCPKKIDT